MTSTSRYVIHTITFLYSIEPSFIHICILVCINITCVVHPRGRHNLLPIFVTCEPNTTHKTTDTFVCFLIQHTQHAQQQQQQQLSMDTSSNLHDASTLITLLLSKCSVLFSILFKLPRRMLCFIHNRPLVNLPPRAQAMEDDDGGATSTFPSL